MSPKTLETMMGFVDTIARPALVKIGCQWCSTNVEGRGWDEVEAKKDLAAKLQESGWSMILDTDVGERFPCCKFCVDRVVGVGGKRVRAKAKGARV